MFLQGLPVWAGVKIKHSVLKRLFEMKFGGVEQLIQ